MSHRSAWNPLEPDLKTILSRETDPLYALSEGRVPAIIFRRAYDPAHCRGLIRRFIERELIRDPDDPEAARRDPRTRIDIGTSLGNMGGHKEAFLDHAIQTHELFKTLFDGFPNPVEIIYHALDSLAAGKKARVAVEPDGRLYGPAIFRIHYEGHRYKPHIDHVSLREKRFNYAVTRFDHQFAGVMCFQNAVFEGRCPQAILHHCIWTPEVQDAISTETFPDYASEHGIGCYQVDLEPGDLYFFNTRLIHEVPMVEGNAPRIVLATFIGYSSHDPEIYVWS